MMHLLFLLVSLGLVLVSQKLALIVLARLKDWKLRRCWQILALTMPVSVLLLFSLTMLPTVVNPQVNHYADYEVHQEWLIALVGMAVVVTPWVAAFFLNLGRLGWLYFYTLRRTWEAPKGLVELAHDSYKKPAIRLWYSLRPFAFNLPGLWPGMHSLVILSTGLVGQLEEEELRAVIWHEEAHLARKDFWVIWLASWWQLAFFYLPPGRRFFAMLQGEQELACDAQVARLGGQPMALALADALLKVWEELVVKANQGVNPKTIGFNPPGLATYATTDDNLTEQRVNRLIEIGSSPNSETGQWSIQAWFTASGLLGGSVSLWLVGLELLHIIMLPLGCAISLSLL